MRTVLTVIGVLLVLVGFGWFLQGINVLPGSFMTGQVRWALYGGVAVVVGVALVIRYGTRKTVVNTVAAILLLMGTVWFLQGVNVLPGSFMTGQVRWAVYGGIVDLVGLVLVIVNRGTPHRRPRSA
jgi:C4-dicarboxylate transporter